MILVVGLRYPILIVNFKTYLESQGKRGLELSKVAAKISRESGVCIAVAPQPVDIRAIADSVEIPVFAQHLDPEPPGSQTGHLTPEALKEAGAVGTLLNHSERRLRVDVIEGAVKRASGLGLTTCVCANTPPVGAAVASFAPDMVAVEPPELIGSGVSVSKARPGVVRESVLSIRSINTKVKVLCGAGVTSGEDVQAAMRLGSEGILVASGIVKAKDPRQVLGEFAAKMAPKQ